MTTVMTQENTGTKVLEIGNYKFEPRSRKLMIDSIIITLANKEARVLEYFIERLNTMIPREEIVAAIWGEFDYFKGRSMDVSISRLRRHLRHDKTVSIINKFAVGCALIIIDEDTKITPKP